MKQTRLSETPRATLRALRTQAGMTLMEIIAALAIIAAVVVGALALFNSAQSSNNSVTMLRDIISIRSAVQQLYFGQNGLYQAAGNGAANQQLFNARKIPTDLVFINQNTGFRTPWGGALSIFPGPIVNNAAPTFEIRLTNVPADVCLQLVTSASNGWSLTTVNGQAVANVAVANLAYPVTPARANNPCSANAAGVNVVFRTIN